MSLWKDLLLGRPDGLRSTVRKPLASMLGLSPQAEAPPPMDEPIEAGEKALNLGIEPPKDVTPPDGYEVVLHRDALQPGQVVEVIIAGKAIAVANIDGEYHACSNVCPHAEGPLGEGQLEGTVLTCPYHGWQFDITDGSCVTSPEDAVPVYPVQIVKDAVCVAI
jgi:nitrite reductase (NADH) small subunit